MGFGSQLLLLLWKNFVLQKRKICVTVFEILMPIFFAFLLLVIRILVSNTDVTTDTVWTSFTVDSQQPPSLIKSRVLYAPNQLAVTNLMSTVKTDLGSNFTFTGYASESALLTEYNAYSSSVWAAVVFDETQDYTVSLPTTVKYKLRVARLKTSDRWRTDDTYPVVQRPDPRNNDSNGGTPNYYATGFLGLQYSVSKAVVNTFASSPVNFSAVDIQLQKIPFPPYVKDNLLTVLQLNLPFFLLLGFILNALQLTRDITYEKEKRLRESMKMMGLKTSVYWLSWFLKALIYLLIVCIAYSILFTIKIGQNGKILNESAGSLVFVFLLLYVLSIIAFCFMISAFFNTATIASIAAGILFFLFYMPFFFLNDDYENMSTGAKLACCLLNQMAMAFGCYTIGLYEGTGAGATWSSFSKPATVDDNFSLLQAMAMLIFDTVLYFLVAWYVDNVKPGEYGIPNPLYFPFTKTYWCGEKRTDEVYGDELRPKTSRPELFERDPTDLKVGISINKLRKEFGKGKKKKIAVSGTSLNMYEGQITALLGHNGAGKTTTMSMLTGFIPPTSGTASVNGYDIVKNISGVRESIGLCPQHNILFDTLTVEEHLDFYASLKGLEKSKIKQAIDEMIVILGLESKRNKKSMTLSGGQKRKLSVGIAIIGDSKIVILDEPTSGMDPQARRQTWDILQKFREGRTMVLSTHFMDEADLLGDRIAIMSEGVVKCCGTSLFLKKAYGAGYHLVIVKDKSCNVPNLTSMIQSHVPGAFLESEISAELSYILPFDESAKFEKLFLELENKRQALGVGSFGTSATTMEEVFLNPAKGENDLAVDFKPKQEAEKNNVAEKNQTIDFARNVEKNTGLHLSFQQYYAMLVKKFIHTYRNKIISIVQLAMPIIFTVLALLIEKTNSPDAEEPALTLDLASFGGTTFVYSGQTTTAAIATTYKNSLTSAGHSADDYNAQTTYTTFDDYLIAKAKSVGQSSFDKSYIVAAEFVPASGSSNPSYTAYFNGEPLHTPAISLNYMMDTLLKENNSTSTSMTVINHPLPVALTDNSAASTSALTIGFSIAFTLLFGMAFLTASFVLFPIKERFTGAKHLQVVSGVSPFAYWVSNFTWDVINYLVPMIGIIIAFVAFQAEAYVYGGRIGIIILLFLIYGWCCLPFVYLLHYMFTSPATGVVSVTMLNIFTGSLYTVYLYK
ncbi:hypothetical protein KUTeg_020064 [Tegillarca granosa]|uniref:ABC transporter domain-containing protein n=1 Tax=Tegillarca granosa TaxID=220873 RepID=A0ABQ9EBY6_TEGGR|nr:hypothetical protein KUTeg_020064 [Tegillarca granosa]